MADDQNNTKRRRISKACDECNRRKVKCDGNLPCATCTKNSKECTYVNPNRRRKDGSQVTLARESRESSSNDFSVVDYIEAISPQPYIKEYTHQELADLKITDQYGNSIYWMEIYYTFCYQRNGLFPRRIFDQIYYDLPTPLIHAMIACCQPYSSDTTDIFSTHFEICSNTKGPYVDPTSLFGILIELHMTIYYVFSSRATSAIYSGTLCIRMGQMLGIHEFREMHILSARTNAYLPTGVSRELGARCWIYLYCVDFYSRPLFHVPSCIHQDVSEDMLLFFHSPEFVRLDHEDAFGLAVALVPLIRIGRRFYQIWDRSIPPIAKEMELNNISSDLKAYYAKLPIHPLTMEFVVFDQRNIWENYVHMVYHFIELLIFITPFSTKIDVAPLDHPIIQATIHSCMSILRYIHGHLKHNPTFAHMPILIGRVVMLSGVALAAYAHRDPKTQAYVADHIRALQLIGQSFSQVFLSHAEELKMMSFDPPAAIQHLKTLIL